MKNNYKVVIVGGGASGLLCAVELLRGLNAISPSDLLILEGNDRVGKKILSTGNGQCNISNLNISANKYHGGSVGFVDSALADFPNDFLLNFFKMS